MALYRRIFPHRGRDKKGRWFRSCRPHKKDYNFSTPEALASYNSWQAPEFDRDQIRLIVFIKCDQKERKLLFDSKAVKKNDDKAEPSPAKGNPCKFSRRFGGHTGGKNSPMESRQSENPGTPSFPGDPANKYTCLRPSSDILLLGEMMYGSVAMAYRGSTIKVHTIKSPPKLMLSQVSVLRPKENLDQDSISLAPVELMIPQRTDCPARDSIAHSLPVAVPPSSTYNSIDEDSGVVSGSSSSFLTPFPSPGSSVSSNQSNSFHRRWLRNQVTSMEHGVRRKSSLETLTVDEPVTRRRHPKIGVGVVISLPGEEDHARSRHFQTFFFSHFMLFEGHFHHLSLAVEKALTYQRRMFIPIVMDALDEFRSAVYSLYCAPRIQRPIWLNMMTYQMQRGHLCEHLMHELVVELQCHNNKQTNFFFSRLLTAVLMYHLAWVPTVVPAEATPSRAYLDKHSSTLLDMLAKSHPYNPLWAQLGDIFGAIGYPVKVAKTIVVGRRADVVCRLLYILSYFIRCSEVHEIPEHREKIYIDYEDTWELEKIDVIREKMEEKAHDAVPKTEGALCSDSADSGLESSFDSGGRTDIPAVLNTEGGTEKVLGKESLSTNTLTQGRAMEESTSASRELDESGDAVRAERCHTPPGDLWDRQRGASDPGSGVVGLGAPEAARSLSTGNLTETARVEPVGRINRSSSGGLYPDLQEILSGTVDDIPIARLSQMAERDTPSVLLNDAVFVAPKEESVAPAEGLQTPGAAAIQARSFDEACLDSKRDHAVAVGRSAPLETQAGLVSAGVPPAGKTNAEARREGRPGHDRSSAPPAPEDPLSECRGSPTTKRQAPTSLSLYPAVDLGDVSVDATPVPSTENTDVESLDGTPPVPRRNKRFPLTSPLARAYQESLTAKEGTLDKSSNESGANELDAKTPTNGDFSATRWPQTASAGHQLRPKDISGIDHSRLAVLHCPAPSHQLQIGEGLRCEATDSRGQQMTPVQHQNYHRCFSDASTGSSGYSDMTLLDHEELPIAFSEPVTPETDPGESYVDNFGRSLLGGYSQTYVPDMALHGVPDLDRKKVLANLEQASQHSVLDEEIAEAVCIVADTDTWAVELLSSKRIGQSADRPAAGEIAAANCVGDLLESVQNMCNLRMPSDFCLMHLEDQLQEVYFKSTALASYLDQNSRAGPKELAGVLGLDSSDLPLLLSVVGVHSPSVIRSAARESYEMRQESWHLKPNNSP